MTAFFILAILALGFLIVFQISKASEYVSVLKGEKKSFEQANRVNAFLLMAFLVLGLIGVWWCNELFYDKTLFVQPSASDHGEKIDAMMWITLAITGFVFFLTQIILFWFAYKYQYKPEKKAFYFPHNNKLEFIWTTVPAIALCVLVGFGLYYWFKITGDAPADALKVEITGKQFSWIYRYPGKDNEFGKKYYRLIDEGKSNLLGMTWKDTSVEKKDGDGHVFGVEKITADPKGFDDIISTESMYLPVGKPVKLIINSRDVIHDVGLAHFRLKMDAVPGTPTTMWFTPKFTTAQMREITKNPEFEYEISCDQMCGNSHFSMKGIIKVVSESEFILWRAQQKPAYVLAGGGAGAPAATPQPPQQQAPDTAAKTTATNSANKPIAKN